MAGKNAYTYYYIIGEVLPMQHEIVKSEPLLDKNGCVAEPGWARGLISRYSRADIKASPIRIKEWDYYLISNNSFALALTVADNGYMGLISASVLEFEKPWEKTTSIITPFPMGKYKLPETSAEGETAYSDSRVNMCFAAENGIRRIECVFHKFLNDETLEAELTLTDEPKESMVIATPFEKPKAFYYNQKINCMRANGYMRLGKRVYDFGAKDSYATLDWGRGVWTYDNTWYWGNGNGNVNGHRVGFNIGYGFGDTSAATENVIIYDGIVHKLSNVSFNIPADSFMKPWTFSSDDGRFEMDFVPVIDRAARTSALIIESDQHQVFGRFTGKMILDGGETIELNNFMGFAEKVRNRY
jgi:hypothetical protein